MRDARAEVTGRVDRVAGRATERGADADHEQGDGQRAERGEAAVALASAAEADDDEDEHERADDLGDEVPAVERIAGPVEKTPSLFAASGSASKCCL